MDSEETSWAAEGSEQSAQTKETETGNEKVQNHAKEGLDIVAKLDKYTSLISAL